MDFDTEQQEKLALLPDTVLHDCIRILDVEEINENDIVYIAEYPENGEEISVREYCPSHIVRRNGLDLSCPEQDENFRSGLKQFEKMGQLLKNGVPHMPEVLDFWYENHTAYYAVKLSDGDSFRRTVPIPTAVYVQSLGIMLCDMYAKLHENHLYYGAITENDLTFTENGSLISEPHITENGTEAEDLHNLTKFLRNLLSETVEAKENLKNQTALTVTEQALQYHYERAELLKSALIGEDGKGIPVRRGKNHKPFLIGACVFCLGACIFGGLTAGKPASARVVEEFSTETIQPEIISVWVPLDENQDEQNQIATYQKLAEGFERQHKGFGVDVTLFDATEFSSALDSMNGENMPAVFMNTLDERATQKASDLASLAFSIDNIYITDLDGFGNVMPIGCSVPVLYCNTHYMANSSRTISGGELPADTLYDTSAGDFITKQSTHQPQEQLKNFLADGSHPMLGSSDLFYQIQENGEISGAVRMIPVTTSDNACVLQYEYYCTVNADCPENTQKTGMLWLQYLLTEEAQTILFVENSGALPLHEKAVAKALTTHQALQVLSGLRLDSSILQEKR